MNTMNKGVLLLVVAVLAVSGMGKDAGAQATAFWTEAGKVRRYHLVRVSDQHICLIDTVTGHCWSKLPGRSWRDEGNPTQIGVSEAEPSARATKPTSDSPGSRKRV